jgi:hypothetical protein
MASVHYEVQYNNRKCVKWKTVREQFTSSDKAYEYVETFTVPTRFRILRVTTECVMESTIEPE